MSIFGTPSTGSSGSQQTTGNTTRTATVNTQNGDLIIVYIGAVSSESIMTAANGSTGLVTDTIGNSYTLLTKRTTSNASGARIAYCLKSNGANSSNVVTVTHSNALNGDGIFVWSVPVTGGVASFDVEAGASSASAGTNHVTGSFSTGGTDEIGFVGQQSYLGTWRGTEYSGPSGGTTDIQALPTAAGQGISGTGHITWSTTQSGITLTITSVDSLDTAIVAAMFSGTVAAAPVVSGWSPTIGQPAVPHPFAPGDFFHPEKVIPFVPTPPPPLASTPTIGAKAVPQPYQGGSIFTAPEKVLPFTPAPITVVAWTPTTGQKSLPQNYAPCDYAAPPKFGLSGGGALSYSYVRLKASLQFQIDPQGYVRLAGTLNQPTLQYVNLAGTIRTKALNVIQLAGTLQVKALNYVNLKGTIFSGNRNYVKFGSIGALAQQTLNFVNLAGTLKAKVNVGPCGNFPDAAFINLAGWLINPASQNDSIQMPGQGFTRSDDWLSSNDALASYKPTSRFTILGGTLPSAGIGILVTAFTAGVVSFQTRTRTWLRRVDQAGSGILINTKTNTHTLPNGTIVTTITQTRQQQDTLVTTTTIQNSGTPTRTSIIVTEKKSNGQILTRETETDTISGIVNSLEKRTLTTQPPNKDNIQPLVVRTLDGVSHYQFFQAVNTEWSGGDQEGTTSVQRKVQVVPGTLNGQTTDPFGNIIYNQITDEIESDPTGKVITTHKEEIGTRKDIGTTTTDTNQQFSGLLVTVTKKTTLPDGSAKIVNTVTNPISGDQTTTTTETVTDEYGQVTTTVTLEETKTFADPVTGVPRQTTTKTVNVTKGGVTTTDVSVDTTTDYEDDIVRNKVKVYFIQEFTITCVIDEFSMMALSEINITHQKNYALLELFGQQLGNANLSYSLRQQLINQFNTANSCISPVTLQALGRNYRVVFAQSASSFRAKYIPGTEPHVYELQLILQERSDLMNGAFGG